MSNLLPTTIGAVIEVTHSYFADIPQYFVYIGGGCFQNILRDSSVLSGNFLARTSNYIVVTVWTGDWITFYREFHKFCEEANG